MFTQCLHNDEFYSLLITLAYIEIKAFMRMFDEIKKFYIHFGNKKSEYKQSTPGIFLNVTLNF